MPRGPQAADKSFVVVAVPRRARRPGTSTVAPTASTAATGAPGVDYHDLVGAPRPAGAAKSLWVAAVVLTSEVPDCGDFALRSPGIVLLSPAVEFLQVQQVHSFVCRFR